MLESEQQRYSKFEESIRACLQRYSLLTEHSFLFNSFLHINRVPTMSWLAWQGKRMPLYGWTIGTFFLNATGLCSFSIQGNIVVRDSAFWPRPKNVVHHFHVLLYYNELCTYTARFKTCQENSIFFCRCLCFTDHRIVSFQRLESYYFAWHPVLIMMIMLTFYIGRRRRVDPQSFVVWRAWLCR